MLQIGLRSGLASLLVLVVIASGGKSRALWGEAVAPGSWPVRFSGWNSSCSRRVCFYLRLAHVDLSLHRARLCSTRPSSAGSRRAAGASTGDRDRHCLLRDRADVFRPWRTGDGDKVWIGDLLGIVAGATGVRRAGGAPTRLAGARRGYALVSANGRLHPCSCSALVLGERRCGSARRSCSFTISGNPFHGELSRMVFDDARLPRLASRHSLTDDAGVRHRLGIVILGETVTPPSGRRALILFGILLVSGRDLLVRNKARTSFRISR